jgi:hypothetical protein
MFIIDRIQITIVLEKLSQVQRMIKKVYLSSIEELPPLSIAMFNLKKSYSSTKSKIQYTSASYVGDVYQVIIYDHDVLVFRLVDGKNIDLLDLYLFSSTISKSQKILYIYVTNNFQH